MAYTEIMNKDSRVVTKKQAARKKPAILNETEISAKQILNEIFDNGNYVVKDDSSVTSVLGFSDDSPLNVLFSPKHNFLIARTLSANGDNNNLTTSFPYKAAYACIEYAYRTNIWYTRNYIYERNEAVFFFYFEN